MITRAFGIASVWVGIVGQSTASASMAPIGDWKVEPSDARCVAVRQYGDPETPITLAIKAPGSESDVLQLAIIRPGYRKSAEQSGVKLSIDGQEFDTFVLGYPLAGQKRTASLFNLSPPMSAALRKGGNFSFSVKGGTREYFAVGSSQSLWKNLSECVERLKRTWNIGVDSRTNMMQGVKGSLQGIFTQADYPREALARGFTGASSILLLIDEAGHVKDCTILETSGMAVLDAKACGVITQRAKFTPAVGLDGKPAKDSYKQRINWMLKR